MDFYQKYELIDPLPGEGTKSFSARQTATGRAVTVHLLVGGQTPENEKLLVRLRALSPDAMPKVIEVGDNDGTQYVVTIAPPYLHLNDWLSGEERAASAADAQKFTRAGVWKVPAARPEPPVAAPPGEFTKMFQKTGPVPITRAGETPPSTSQPGEFTKLFQAADPAATPKPPAPEKEIRTPVEAPKAEPSQPGEFTRLFQTPAKEGTMATAPMPATLVQAKPLESLPPKPPAASPPSEFTRMFQAPGSEGNAASTPLPATQPPSGTGGEEFERMFNSPLPHAPAQGEWPPAAPKAAEPGAFTQMFQSSSPASQASKSGPEGQQSGEFTRFFHAPPGTPQGPQLPSTSGFPAPLQRAPTPAAPAGRPGEFTQMFGRPSVGPEVPQAAPSPPSSPPPRSFGGSSATQAFSVPTTPQAPRAAPQGPSEYTRMMSTPSNVAPPVAPQTTPGGAPQIPQMLQPGMPQMPQPPYVPQPVIPQPNVQQPYLPQPVIPQPQIARPQPAAPAPAPSSNLLLIVIFCLLAFLVGGFVVYLLVRH
jgi:hypothetical protein